MWDFGRYRAITGARFKKPEPGVLKIIGKILVLWIDGGTRQECLAYIKEVWRDMRPLSLREKMQEQGLG
jgi:hypothetical protein